MCVCARARVCVRVCVCVCIGKNGLILKNNADKLP